MKNILQVIENFTVNKYKASVIDELQGCASGEIKIWTHAVSVILQSITNALHKLDHSIEDYKVTDTDEHRKEIICCTAMITEHVSFQIYFVFLSILKVFQAF